MRKRCGAKTRSGGECKSYGMENGRCRMHGGTSLRGMAHPNYQGKGRSKYMPKFLAPSFGEALEDPELLNLSESISAQEAVIRDLFQSLDDAAAPTRLVKLIRQKWAQFWEATGREDHIAVNKYRGEITGLLKEAATVAATIDRISRAEETKRRLVETEMKRRVKAQELILLEDAKMLYDQLIQANQQVLLEANVLERSEAVKLLSSIVGRFAEIAGVLDEDEDDS